MRRSVIMSHGRVHDEDGLKGTYMRGSIPAAKVQKAIPKEQQAIGQVDEPGVQNTAPPKGRPKFIMDPVEGTLRLGKARRGVATSRPDAEEMADDRSPQEREADAELDGFIAADAAKKKAAEAAQVPTAPEPEPEAESLAPPAPAAPEEPAEPQGVAMPTSARKIARAKRDELDAWCAALEITPEDHLADSEEEEVTARLLRKLVTEKMGF